MRSCSTATDRVREIQVKRADARSHWIWGAFKMPGRVLHELRRSGASATAATSISARWSTPIWRAAARRSASRPESAYVDVGTLHGYREAIALLGETAEKSGGAGARVALGWPGGRAFHDVNRQ